VGNIIALFNQSGGVGKTTLTMNVGYQLAARGHRTLIVDADPQSSLTVFMGLHPFRLSKTIYDAVVREEALPIHRNIHQLDLVPSNIILSKAEMELASAIRREDRLAAALEPHRDAYDFILIDCPPSLGILSIMCLVAATHLLIPIQTEYKAVEGTMLLLNTILETLQKANRDLKVAGLVPTMYDARTSQGVKTLDYIEKIFGQLQQHKIFEKSRLYPAIPRRTDFADAASAHVPLAIYAPKNEALQPLNVLTESLENL
jgi:chromosome partitioning protein